jgi:predicted ATPase
LLRIKGELVLRQGRRGASKDAERYFMESLDWSRRQQTVAWELRAATSLARLRQLQERNAEAREVLSAVYEKFDEGLQTTDLVAARDLLASLAH